MGRYAEGTSVSVDRTRGEIEDALRRFGADAVSVGYEGLTAFIMFRAHGRFIRLTLALPDPQDRAFTDTPSGRWARSAVEAQKAYDAERRRRWRSLGLLVKAKIAAIQDGIAEFETEFLAHVVLPSGETVAEHARPAIKAAYDTGKMPRLLPPMGRG